MATVVQLESCQQRTIADDLQIQFDSAQKLLIESIAELARSTARPSPDPVEYTGARLRISQASLARSSAFNSVCEFLRPRVDSNQWTTVAALKAANTGVRMYSAAHVAEWTNERIEADWAGYCLASKGMRMRMGEMIHRGRAVLCPLLDQISKGRFNPSPLRDSRVVAGRLSIN
jgi:hypothetical protein